MFYWQLNEVNSYKANCFAFVKVGIGFMLLAAKPGWVPTKKSLPSCGSQAHITGVKLLKHNFRRAQRQKISSYLLFIVPPVRA